MTILEAGIEVVAVGYGTYRIGFINDEGKEDETEYSAKSLSELNELYSEFCKENNFKTDTVTYIERAGNEVEERANNFIKAADGSELCSFCTLSDECPKSIVCYGGEPIEPPCTDMTDEWIDRHIDKEAIVEYLDSLEE